MAAITTLVEGVEVRELRVLDLDIDCYVAELLADLDPDFAEAAWETLIDEWASADAVIAAHDLDDRFIHGGDDSPPASCWSPSSASTPATTATRTC